jgi:hypothetical protein
MGLSAAIFIFPRGIGAGGRLRRQRRDGLRPCPGGHDPQQRPGLAQQRLPTRQPPAHRFLCAQKQMRGAQDLAAVPKRAPDRLRPLRPDAMLPGITIAARRAAALAAMHAAALTAGDRGGAARRTGAGAGAAAWGGSQDGGLHGAASNG